MYYKTKGYRIFNIFNTCLLIFLAIMCIVPLVHVLTVSFSAKSAADANLVGLWPKQFSHEAYKKRSTIRYSCIPFGFLCSVR